MDEHKDEVEALFQLCVRMYERMERQDIWPWMIDDEGNTVLIQHEAAAEKPNDKTP